MKQEELKSEVKIIEIIYQVTSDKTRCSLLSLNITFFILVLGLMIVSGIYKIGLIFSLLLFAFNIFYLLYCAREDIIRQRFFESMKRYLNDEVEYKAIYKK